MPSLNDVVKRLTRFVERVFKTSLEVFFEALRHSPNAQGYVAGSISELLIKKHLENLGYELLRIRESGKVRRLITATSTSESVMR